MKSETLEIKIIALLGMIIFIIIFIYSVIFSNHYEAYEERIIGQESISTLHSMNTSINTVIQNADDYSKMLIADSIIQQHMESGNLFHDITDQQGLINRIYALLQFSNSVDAVWLIDKQGQRFTVGGGANICLESEEKDISTYRELQKPYGKSKLILEKTGGQTNLALVRSYNSLENFSSLGIIGVDINRNALERLITESIDSENEQVVILNEDNEIICWSGERTGKAIVLEIAEKLGGTNTELLESKNIDHTGYLISGIIDTRSRWKIVRFTEIQRNRSVSEIVKFNLALIVLIGLVILIGAASISGMLTRPIQQLLVCMKDVENGTLTRVEEGAKLQEFRILFKGYNHMIDRIEVLIQEIIERQRRIRQVELNEVQEQMKPHFLYNTLDSIEALAMMGDTEKVCKLVEALGDFYRKSVSGGREFLSIKEEFQMAKDYAEIMKIRFGETFSCDIELEDQCCEYEIPKLTIQPLVENAFQHGIRTKKKYGHIRVGCSMKEDKIHIMVMDNGDGVPEDVVEELAKDKEPGMGKSLGLRGTIERLRLLYGEGFSYRIENERESEIHLYIDAKILREQRDGKIKSNTD